MFILFISWQDVGFTADPIDDNIYQWCVKLFNFDPGTDLAKDLNEIHEKFDYNYIELQLVSNAVLYVWINAFLYQTEPSILSNNC